MNDKDLIRHRQIDTPAYLFWVRAKPHIKGRGKGKKSYMMAVRQAAATQVCLPITEKDIEVEINYSTLAEEGVRADIDNVIKPTLDALKEVVYRDDRQVRSVTATIFDRNRGNMITGLVEYMGHLFDSPDEDVLLIAIYSDSRLHELGGKEAVKKKRFEEWEKEFSKAASKAAYGVEQ